MTIRMKVALKGALKGVPYELAEKEVTGIFDATHEARFIAAGIAERVDPLDRDGNGAAGGSSGADELVSEINGFALWRVGGGWYRITGPGIEEPVKAKGKAAAEEKFGEIAVLGAINDAINDGVLTGPQAVKDAIVTAAEGIDAGA